MKKGDTGHEQLGNIRRLNGGINIQLIKFNFRVRVVGKRGGKRRYHTVYLRLQGECITSEYTRGGGKGVQHEAQKRLIILGVYGRNFTRVLMEKD